ncbi:MAG: Membrane protein [uncultured Gemmatimonadaceae bacterium]|uniref:Membrane protein n=1 Tax=uncultured Gemmatimonadaceae bacterium TaxID=246130 RepID=A0A6J4KZR7_9BACT|nr:MAG: Membrane protein [uncultured Gemmatimonadaceae bacterium]
MSAALVGSATLAAPSTAGTSPRTRRAGGILTGVAGLFLAFDAAIKFLATREAVAGTVQLGWAPHHLPILGLLELACLILYLVPRTAPLGAVLWTGYLGGAIATHLRLDNPLFSHTLFPLYVAACVWGGLYLRDARVRALVVHPAR